jgi:hypothetical protein
MLHSLQACQITHTLFFTEQCIILCHSSVLLLTLLIRLDYQGNSLYCTATQESDTQQQQVNYSFVDALSRVYLD